MFWIVEIGMVCCFSFRTGEYFITISLRLSTSSHQPLNENSNSFQVQVDLPSRKSLRLSWVGWETYTCKKEGTFTLASSHWFCFDYKIKGKSIHSKILFWIDICMYYLLFRAGPMLDPITALPLSLYRLNN